MGIHQHDPRQARPPRLRLPSRRADREGGAATPHDTQPPTAPPSVEAAAALAALDPTPGIAARLAVTPVIFAAEWMLVPPLRDEDTPLEFFVFLVILAGAMGIYYVSLRLNPYVDCSKCHGQPRPRAWFFGYAHHVCSKCQGTGQQLRFGRRLFGMGPP